MAEWKFPVFGHGGDSIRINGCMTNMCLKKTFAL